MYVYVYTCVFQNRRSQSQVPDGPDGPRRHVPLVVLDDPFCALDKEVAVQAIPTEVGKDGWIDFPGIWWNPMGG